MDEFDRFREWLDSRAAKGGRLRLWLRDDDATQPTPALDRLLDLAIRHDVPALLAVIPGELGAELPAHIVQHAGIQVAPHGWRHLNHAAPGQKSNEFGDGRAPADLASELRRGLSVISAAFGDKRVPIFVAPWNRIGPDAISALPAAGYAALSVFGAADPGRPPRINTQVDLIDWRGTRGGRSAEALLGDVQYWADTKEPAVGLLSHHLVHDDAAWVFLERFFQVTSGHPAVAWVDARTLVDETRHAMQA